MTRNHLNDLREKYTDVVWNGKADGSTGDGIAFSIVGDHENRPTDMTNILIYEIHSDRKSTERFKGEDNRR